MSDTAPFPLSVSFHTLDLQQQLEAIWILVGSSVKSVELYEPTFAKDERNVREARAAFAAVGVEPRTVHANFGGPMDISSPDTTIRLAGMEAVSVAIDLAVRMGAGMVIVHPSAGAIGEDEREARMEQSKRSIETIAGMARQAGRRVAIEFLPRMCLGRSAAELLSLVEDVDASTAGVCLDTNHLMDGFASLPEVVRSLAPRLFSLHCSDYDGGDEKHWPPLRGVIDWPAFLSALSAVGFSGPLHYEARLDGQTPAERLAFLEVNFSQLMKAWLQRGKAERED